MRAATTRDEVEVVARAICKAWGYDWDAEPSASDATGDETSWADPRPSKALFREGARAAIDAYRRELAAAIAAYRAELGEEAAPGAPRDAAGQLEPEREQSNTCGGVSVAGLRLRRAAAEEAARGRDGSAGDGRR